jgi:hypothetical protein
MSPADVAVYTEVVTIALHNKTAEFLSHFQRPHLYPDAYRQQTKESQLPV